MLEHLEFLASKDSELVDARSSRKIGVVCLSVCIRRSSPDR